MNDYLDTVQTKRYKCP